MTDPRERARWLVWNDEEDRPRAPLRLGGHTLLFGLVLVVASVALAVTLGPTPFAGLSPLSALGLNAAVVGVAVVAASLAAARWLDRRPLADLGLGVDRAWWRDLGAGLALGAALQTGILLTNLAAGWTVVDGVGGPGVAVGLLGGAALMAWVGFYEELWFRGYYLVNLAEGLVALPGVTAQRAVLVAAVLTSVGFGGVHATNPNATVVSTALIVGYGGYLAVGYLLTGDLALPVGFHAAWNYVQAFVYGFPVSGYAIEASLLATTTAGPEALTGGQFGPEAGLVGVAWALASLPALWWWVRRTRGEVRSLADIAVPRLRGERRESDDGTAGEP